MSAGDGSAVISLFSVVVEGNCKTIRNDWTVSDQGDLRGFAVSCCPHQSAAVVPNGSSFPLWAWSSFQGLKKKIKIQQVCVGAK